MKLKYKIIQRVISYLEGLLPDETSELPMKIRRSNSSKEDHLMGDNLFNYEFVNNSKKSLSYKGPDGTQYQVLPKGKVKVTLDSTSPVSTRVWFAKVKKIYIQLPEFIGAMREVTGQLRPLSTYRYIVVNPDQEVIPEVTNDDNGEVDEEPSGSSDKNDTDPNLQEVEMRRLWIENFIPVMKVGESQDVSIGVEGISSFKGFRMNSSDESVASAKGRKIVALRPGDVVITVKLAGLTSQVNLQIVNSLE